MKQEKKIVLNKAEILELECLVIIVFQVTSRKNGSSLLAIEANKFKGSARPQRLAASNGMEPWRRGLGKNAPWQPSRIVRFMTGRIRGG